MLTIFLTHSFKLPLYLSQEYKQPSTLLQHPVKKNLEKTHESRMSRKENISIFRKIKTP